VIGIFKFLVNLYVFSLPQICQLCYCLS